MAAGFFGNDCDAWGDKFFCPDHRGYHTVEQAVFCCKKWKSFPVESMAESGIVDIHRSASKGWTPLHFAAVGGHTAVVKSLLNSGCDVNRLSYGGRTAFSRAVLTFQMDTAHLLKRHGGTQ